MIAISAQIRAYTAWRLEPPPAQKPPLFVSVEAAETQREITLLIRAQVDYAFNY